MSSYSRSLFCLLWMVSMALLTAPATRAQSAPITVVTNRADFDLYSTNRTSESFDNILPNGTFRWFGNPGQNNFGTVRVQSSANLWLTGAAFYGNDSAHIVAGGGGGAGGQTFLILSLPRAAQTVGFSIEAGWEPVRLNLYLNNTPVGETTIPVTAQGGSKFVGVRSNSQFNTVVLTPNQLGGGVWLDNLVYGDLGAGSRSMNATAIVQYVPTGNPDLSRQSVRLSAFDPGRGGWVTDTRDYHSGNYGTMLRGVTVTKPVVSEDGVAAWTVKTIEQIRFTNTITLNNETVHYAIYDRSRGAWWFGETTYANATSFDDRNLWTIQNLSVGTNNSVYWTTSHRTGPINSPTTITDNVLRGYNAGTLINETPTANGWMDGFVTRPIAYFVPSVTRGTAPLTVSVLNYSLLASGVIYQPGPTGYSGTGDATFRLPTVGNIPIKQRVGNSNGAHEYTQTITVTPSVPPTASKIVGKLKSVDTRAGIAYGYAQDPGARSTALTVKFYIRRPDTSINDYIGETTANLPDGDDTDGDHGFAFTIPPAYRNGSSHLLYVYGIDATGDPDSELAGTPWRFKLR